MDQRQIAIEQLKDLRKKVSRVDSFSDRLSDVNGKISDAEATIKREEKVLRGSIDQKWREVNYVHNEKDAIVNFEKGNAAKAKSRKTICCVLGVLANLVIFALSIMFLVNEPETSWIKTSEYLYLFWIVHIVLGLGISIAPAVLMHSSDK